MSVVILVMCGIFVLMSIGGIVLNVIEEELFRVLMWLVIGLANLVNLVVWWPR